MFMAVKLWRLSPVAPAYLLQRHSRLQGTKYFQKPAKNPLPHSCCEVDDIQSSALPSEASNRIEPVQSAFPLVTLKSKIFRPALRFRPSTRSSSSIKLRL